MTYTAIKPQQVSHDFAVNLQQMNPIPKVAEVVFEVDTGLFKIGDGIRHYKDLPFAGGGSGSGSNGYVADNYVA